MKTVFFGPFIGEFGWEMLYWHAWVNKVSCSLYKNYRKIVSSFSGRESFYPYATEFLGHPKEYLDVFNNCNGYITDYWMNGFPRGNSSINKKFLGIFSYESWEFIDPLENQIDTAIAAKKLLELYKVKLPSDTIFFTPFKIINYNDSKFGVIINKNPLSDQDIVQKPIPFSEQKFEILKPNTSGREKIRKYLNPEDKLIAIFPRNRTIRRSDKNWNKENYIKLISLLKEKYEDYKIGIFGSPGQAYFDDNIPKGTIDFINLPFDQIMNIQVAALQQSKIAIGSLSGAMVVARGCGVPALTWGLKRDAARFYDENQNNIETIFYPIQYPSYKDIFDLSIDMLDKKIEYNVSYDKWCSESYLKTGNGNKKLLKIKLAEFYHSLFYAKN